MINLHFGTSNCLRKEKKTFHKQYLCGLLFSGNKKKTYTGQSILQVFFPLSEKEQLANLRVAT